jgi:hypothetical protein
VRIIADAGQRGRVILPLRSLMLARPAQLLRIARALEVPPRAVLARWMGFVAFELLELEHTTGRQAEGWSQTLPVELYTVGSHVLTCPAERVLAS